MNTYDIYITLSNGSQTIIRNYEAQHPSRAKKQITQEPTPELLAFLSENRDAFISDMQIVRTNAPEWIPNKRFILATFATYERWLLASDMRTGVSIKFKIGRYDKSAEIFRTNPGLSEDDEAASVEAIEQWLKANMRELCYTSAELYRMKQAENLARQMGRDDE